jgi:fluoroquinolone resistance protein
MTERVGGRLPAPTESTVHRADFYGADIADVVHESVLFQDADFDEVTGQGARFVDCTFRSASFVGAALEGCAFENCTFVRCTFLNAALVECKFVGSRFDACTFDQLRVEGGNWSFVGLAGADRPGAISARPCGRGPT